MKLESAGKEVLILYFLLLTKMTVCQHLNKRTEILSAVNWLILTICGIFACCFFNNVPLIFIMVGADVNALKCTMYA